ncbi:hypothetical protein ACM65P_004570 [Vibrio alginolyticus]
MKIYLLVLFSVLSFSSFAQTYTGAGTVHTLRAHANDLWGDSSDFMLVNGFTNAGKCKTSSDGLILIRMPKEEREFSVALAAQLSGKELVVSVDDTRLDSNGYCILRWLNLK